MRLGTSGSPLTAELNRLANNGEYPAMTAFLDAQGAANAWAGTTGLPTVGALNYIANPLRTKDKYKDIDGICNELAGTTGLDASDALATILHPAKVILDTRLGNAPAYYVDAATPTNWGSLGYVRLNGLSGSYMTAQNTAPMQITGDIDLRARLSMDDWTPGTDGVFIARWGITNDIYFGINATGFLQLWWHNNTTNIFNASSVATGIADGTIKWVRATLDVDNGASGNTTTFFTSDDGTNWTQLGSTVVNAGVTSIRSGTAVYGIGSNSGGGTLTAQNVYNAQILSGINGTVVFNMNVASNYLSSNLDTFTATTGQTISVFGNPANTLANLGTAGSLLPTTVGSSTAADSNDAKFLDHTGTNYVYLPGVASNSIYTPSTTALQITGDIDVRVQAAMDDWTPATDMTLASKRTTGNISWELRLQTTGILLFEWYADSVTLGGSKTATVATGVADGAVKWIRATLDVNNGASGNDVKFFTSDNGTTWTQLGTTVTSAGVTSIFGGTANIEIGTRTSMLGAPATGKFYRAQIYSDITETTKVLDVDTSVITAGSATSFTAVTGQTVTINRSTSGRKSVAVTQPTWLFGTDDYMEVNNRYMAYSGSKYLYLPGIVSNFASAPDSAALDIVGDIDVRCKVALDDWTPSAQTALLAKDVITGAQRSYNFGVNTSGQLTFVWTANGSTVVQRISSAATGFADGTTKWVRAVLDVDNGAAGNDVIFYTSDDAITWTQLGTTQTGAGVTSVYSGTAALEIGSNAAGTSSNARGKFFRAQVLNGINGTVAFDANFENSITSLNQASFTESSTNGATVTINRSGSTFRSAGVIDAGYLYPGATNTFSNSTTDFLNFGATDSLSVLAVVRQWNTPVNGGLYISKRDAGSVNVGYEVYPITSNAQFLTLDDGPNGAQSSFTNATIGNLLADVGVVNRTTQTTTFYTNATTNTSPTSISTLGSLSNIGALSIGRRPAGSSGAGGLYQDFELIGAAVFRTVLTAAQISQLNNYFQTRY